MEFLTTCIISIEISIYQELPERENLVHSAQSNDEAFDYGDRSYPFCLVRTEVHQTIFHLTFFFLPLSSHPYKGGHFLAHFIQTFQVFIAHQLLGDLGRSSDILEVFFSPKTDKNNIVVVGLSGSDKFKT